MSWIKRIFTKTEGTFVDVNLHYEFRSVTDGVKGAVKGPFHHTLHITDLSPVEAEKYLNGKRFDWGGFPYPWLYSLEIVGFKSLRSDDIKQYLVEFKINNKVG